MKEEVQVIIDKLDSTEEITRLKELNNYKDNTKKTYDKQLNDLYLLNEDSAKKMFSKQALDNLAKVIKSSSWDLELNKKHYMIKYEQGKQSNILLQTMCLEALTKLFGNKDKIPKEYLYRLKYELDTINKMGFDDYFLVVQDYVNYAKNAGIIVGPGRGSSAGSLVAYLLGITIVDPIKNDLIFERFLNPERVTMPDIDVDFMDDRRNEVVQYLFSKYSRNNVAHIIIFQRMKAKMVIRDIGRILGMNRTIMDSICK